MWLYTYGEGPRDSYFVNLSGVYTIRLLNKAEYIATLTMSDDDKFDFVTGLHSNWDDDDLILTAVDAKLNGDYLARIPSGPNQNRQAVALQRAVGHLLTAGVGMVDVGEVLGLR